MAHAPSYNRENDFALQNLPQGTGDKLNQEYDALAGSVNTNIVNLKAIQRDDQELANGIVKPHTLSPEVLALLVEGTTYKGLWTNAGTEEKLTNPDFTGSIAPWVSIFGATFEPNTYLKLEGVGSAGSPDEGRARQALDMSYDTPVAGSSIFRRAGAQAAAELGPLVYVVTIDVDQIAFGDAGVSIIDTGGVGTNQEIVLASDGNYVYHWENDHSDQGTNIEPNTAVSNTGGQDPTARFDRVSVTLSTSYVLGEMVTDAEGNLYICLKTHWAGATLQGDIDKGYWSQIGGQLQDPQVYAATGGTANAYTASFSPNASLQDGEVIYCKWHVRCNDSPTLNTDGSGALPLVHHDGRSIEHGDLRIDQISMCIYNNARWVVHTNVERLTQIHLSMMHNDDASPAVEKSEGAYLYYEMDLNAKVWTPGFSFRPDGSGGSTLVEVHLEMCGTVSHFNQDVKYKVEFYQQTSFSEMSDLPVLSVEQHAEVPNNSTEEFVMDFEVSIPGTVDFSHMSISIERVDVTSGSEYQAPIALFHVEGRL